MLAVSSFDEIFEYSFKFSKNSNQAFLSKLILDRLTLDNLYQPIRILEDDRTISNPQGLLLNLNLLLFALLAFGFEVTVQCSRTSFHGARLANSHL